MFSNDERYEGLRKYARTVLNWAMLAIDDIDTNHALTDEEKVTILTLLSEYIMGER